MVNKREIIIRNNNRIIRENIEPGEGDNIPRKISEFPRLKW